MMMITKMNNSQICIEQRYVLRRMLARYYEFVEREIIPVNYAKYEEAISSLQDIYIGDKESNNYAILFQHHFICYYNIEVKEIFDNIRKFYTKAKSKWDEEIPLDRNEMIEMREIYEIVMELSLMDVEVNLTKVKRRFDKYLENNISSHELKNYKFIVVMHNSMTNYIHEYRSKYPNIYWYDPYVALAPLTTNVYNVTKMLESIENIRYTTKRKGKNRYTKISIKDTIADLESSIYNNIIPGLCKSPNVDEVFYFAYYHHSDIIKSMDKIPKYEINSSVVNENTKKPTLNVIMSNALTSEHHIINLILTQKMMMIYESDKPYYDSKIMAFRKKKINIYVDQNLLYNPLESSLVPYMEKVDLNDNHSEVLTIDSHLPKLSLNKDISIKFNNFEPGDIIKVIRNEDIILNTSKTTHYKQII